MRKGSILSIIFHPLSFPVLAERVGFEPTEPVKAHSISNAANSTALAPFRENLTSQVYKNPAKNSSRFRSE